MIIRINKKYIFSFSLILLLSTVKAQTDQQRINDLDQLTQGGQQQMFGKSLPPPGVEGSTLYSDDWYLGDVTFTTGRVYKEFFIRYDIAAGIIETKKDSRVVSFKAEDVQKFTWFNDFSKSKNQFVNCKNFNTSDVPLVGFFEVIISDKVSLLSHPVIKVKDPDYVEGLDVGNKNFRVEKNEIYYLAFDDGLYEIKKNNGKNLKYLETKYPDIKDYIKKNKLSFKDKSDLASITKYLNTIEINQN